MGKIKLKQIIGEYMSSADLSEHSYIRLQNIAVRGVRELNMDVYGSFKSKLLPVSANKTVQLPADYISLSKLGILNDKGEVVTLRQNNDLSTIHQQYISDIQQLPQVPVIDGLNIFDPTKYPYLWLNFNGMGGGYNLFGIGGGTPNIGEYKVDDNLGLILLNSDWIYPNVMIEYLSSGYNDEDDDYLVDEKAAEAMICYIRWKNAIDQRKKFSISEVNYFKTEYYRERKLARMRLNQYNIHDMQAVFRSSVKLVAKA